MAPTNLISRGSAWRLAVVLAAVPFLRIGTLIVTPGASWSAVLLDLGALVLVGAAALGGRVLGTGFGSITLAAVITLLPVIGLGALTDAVAGRAASDLMGLLCLLGAGVGFALAVPARAERFEQGLVALLSLGTLAAGTSVAHESRPLADVAALVAPYGVAAVLAALLRPFGRRVD